MCQWETDSTNGVYLRTAPREGRFDGRVKQHATPSLLVTYKAIKLLADRRL
jgi:hypothetical protein